MSRLRSRSRSPRSESPRLPRKFDSLMRILLRSRAADMSAMVRSRCVFCFSILARIRACSVVSVTLASVGAIFAVAAAAVGCPVRLPAAESAVSPLSHELRVRNVFHRGAGEGVTASHVGAHGLDKHVLEMVHDLLGVERVNEREVL